MKNQVSGVRCQAPDFHVEKSRHRKSAHQFKMCTCGRQSPWGVSGRQSQPPAFLWNLKPRTYNLRGFTLIETLVAVTLLTVAVVAPMTLTARSLSTAYYARDQITASHLAQEAVEAVRAIRDGNVLRTALGTPTDLLGGDPADPKTQIPVGQNFRIDTRDNTTVLCSGGSGDQCPFLQTDPESTFYGYDEGWNDTKFRRTVIAEFLTNPEDGTENRDEVRLSVTVSWQTGTYNSREIAIFENLYRWVEEGSGASL